MDETMNRSEFRLAIISPGDQFGNNTATPPSRDQSSFTNSSDQLAWSTEGGLEVESWEEQALFDIRSAFRLAPDWDFEGARAVEADAVHGAVALVRQLRNFVVRPHITATQDGGIGFEWLSDEFAFFVEVNSDTHMEALWRDPESGVYAEDQLPSLNVRLNNVLTALKS